MNFLHVGLYCLYNTAKIPRAIVGELLERFRFAVCDCHGRILSKDARQSPNC